MLKSSPAPKVPYFETGKVSPTLVLLFKALLQLQKTYTNSDFLGLVVGAPCQGDAHTAPGGVPVQYHHHHLVAAAPRLLQCLVSVLYQLLKLLQTQISCG